MSDNGTLIRTRALSKTYNEDGPIPVRAVREVDLDIEAGEFTAVAGPSGSGKTTLLNLVSGLDRPTSGSVQVAGHQLTGLSRSELAEFRLENVGFVFQAYNLIPVLSARENAEFQLLMQGVDRAERTVRVEEELSDLGLEPELFDRRPAALSGGQQQRVAVARALVARPRLILADEPTANLDSETGARLLDMMREMNEKTGITFLFSSHDPMVIERSRRLITLRDGEIRGDETRA